jgi:acetyl-CoA acetyltransferase
METAAQAFERTLADGEVSLDDLGVAEVHDCFTIAELLMMEAMGLEKPGQGIEAVRSGKTRLDGSLPVNTGGGLVGFGHPVGATGVKQAAEIFRQMKGLCGDYQLAKIPSLGIMANMGGDDRTCLAALFENQ